jgi:phosphatidate cytidylyltransferase
MLKQRVITALILLPIALCGFFLLYGGAFALFIGVVVTLGAWEWARLAGFSSQPARVSFALAVAVLLFVLYWSPSLAPWLLAAAVVWWLLATYMVLTYPASAGHWSSPARKLLIGLLVLLPAWQGLVLIKQWPLGNWLIMAVMVLVWGADIGAYFSGKAFGKRKLARAGKVSSVAWPCAWSSPWWSAWCVIGARLNCCWACWARRWWWPSRWSAT